VQDDFPHLCRYLVTLLMLDRSASCGWAQYAGRRRCTGKLGSHRNRCGPFTEL